MIFFAIFFLIRLIDPTKWIPILLEDARVESHDLQSFLLLEMYDHPPSEIYVPTESDGIEVLKFYPQHWRHEGKKENFFFCTKKSYEINRYEIIQLRIYAFHNLRQRRKFKQQFTLLIEDPLWKRILSPQQ